MRFYSHDLFSCAFFRQVLLKWILLDLIDSNDHVRSLWGGSWCKKWEKNLLCHSFKCVSWFPGLLNLLGMTLKWKLLCGRSILPIIIIIIIVPLLKPALLIPRFVPDMVDRRNSMIDLIPTIFSHSMPVVIQNYLWYKSVVSLNTVYFLLIQWFC